MKQEAGEGGDEKIGQGDTAEKWQDEKQEEQGVGLGLVAQGGFVGHE